MESYKSQIADLENKAASRSKEYESMRFDLEQTKTKLRITEEERAKDSETLDLYQERVRELELSSNRPVKPARKHSEDNAAVPGEKVEGGEGGGAGEGGTGVKTITEDAYEDEFDADQGLGGELDDAITGTTMTDLKLQIRKLKRELEAVKNNHADSSRVLVLENLLEDANRMKARYESDYLAAHREKLVLQNNLEEIRSGKSMGDGCASRSYFRVSFYPGTLANLFVAHRAEAAIALRQRLNETVDQLDTLRKDHTELEVKFDSQAKELTIAKSDRTLDLSVHFPHVTDRISPPLSYPVNLVNKDQLEILSSLRESVNEDKTGLESELERMRKQLAELGEKNKMQLEQINGLLLEKVNLQSDSIGQREKALQRERDFGYVPSFAYRSLDRFAVSDRFWARTRYIGNCALRWRAGMSRRILRRRL